MQPPSLTGEAVFCWREPPARHRTGLSGFTSVQVPHKNNNDSQTSWTEFDVDLSAYAGQKIYIAVRNNTPSNGFVTFFDDFYFENFEYVNSDNSAPYFTTVPETTATVGQKD